MTMHTEQRNQGGEQSDGDFAPTEGAPQPALALDEDDRLPWLESAEDDEDEGGIDGGRLVRFALFGLALLVLVGGGLWVLGKRGQGDDQVPAGGVIAAPAEPYKTVPADTGGKTFAGTGDSAYIVSEGKNAPARLGGAEAPVAAPATGAAPAEPAPEGVGVQLAAYSSQAAAEAGWQRLSANPALKGVKHRIVEGSADIGTVYRLQAVTPDVAAANALCSTLKAGGLSCQVKR